MEHENTNNVNKDTMTIYNNIKSSSNIINTHIFIHIINYFTVNIPNEDVISCLDGKSLNNEEVLDTNIIEILEESNNRITIFDLERLLKIDQQTLLNKIYKLIKNNKTIFL